MSKTVQLRSSAGVRNDVSPERFDRDALGRSTGFTDLAESVNLDLDETGKLFRRLGTARLLAGSIHSLYASGDAAYVVVNGVLSALLPDMSAVPLRPVNGRVSMTRIVDAFYWSDIISAGVFVRNAYAPWGIAVPPAFGALPVPGALRAGAYLYTMTYVRGTGEESGAVNSSGIALGANSGISFPALPISADATIVTKRIYITDCNGEVPFIALELPNATPSATYTAMPAAHGMAVRTLFMGPPPAGQVVSYFAGRSLMASGNYLWYSQPYEYGLFDLRNAFIGFKNPVRTVAPVNDGVFVGTEQETFWLAGTDPTMWTLMGKAGYGTVLGTETALLNHLVGRDGAQGSVIAWMSRTGMCIGFDGGTMQNVTGARHIPPAATEGASLLKVRDGTPQIVTTLFN